MGIRTIGSPMKFSWRKFLTTHSIEVTGEVLVYSYEGPFRRRRDKFAVASLDPNESVFSYYGYSELVVAAVCLIGAFGLTYWIMAGSFDTYGMVFAGILASTFLIGGFVRLSRLASEVGTYYLISYKQTSQHALFIPKQPQTAASVERLLAYIANYSSAAFNTDESLAGQLAHLGDLYRKGLLTDEEFRSAKEKMLDKKRPLGFHPSA